MRRGEVWWAELPDPIGRRPVLLLSRNEAYPIRELVTVAPLTTRVRHIPVEVPLGAGDGLAKACVANLDSISTIRKRLLVRRISLLSEQRVREVDDAIRFALGLPD